MALRRLTKEQAEMESDDALESISAGPLGDDMFKWQAMITGPVQLLNVRPFECMQTALCTIYTA